MIQVADNTPEVAVSARVTTPASTQTARAASIAGRDLALDFAKGALVLCMVAYHALNYFRYDVALLRHLHFLPPSFIFIAGFLATRVYLPKIQTGDTTVYRRLLIRGVKIVALFTVINLAVQALFQTSYNRSLGLHKLAANLDAIFLTGEGRATVFGVLLPIGYLLLLAAGLLRVAQGRTWLLQGFVYIVFVGCAFLAHRGALTFNLELLSMGLLGAAAGFIPALSLDRAAAHLAGLLALYLVYSAFISAWYPTYLINVLGVTLALLLLYSIGKLLTEGSWLARSFALLGNYSLFSYLVQIAVLQVLFRLGRGLAAYDGAVLVAFATTCLLTFGAAVVTDRARRRSRVIDQAYRGVFA